MEINLPEDVRFIIRSLNEYGYEAYAVGGCIRDSISNRMPKDWDITTDAPPEQVKKLFRKTIDTGIKHGTVTVMLHKTAYEVTTYRIDGSYKDRRHPESVEFTMSLEEDLKRRDFTVNAMAYNEKNGLVDLFGGINDINNRIIRCVGEPEERFSEDALRMLRAVRFSAELGYSIEKKTAEAVCRLAPTINGISKERIHAEINRILLSGNPDYIKLVKELKISKAVFPVLDGNDELETSVELLKMLPKELFYGYAALMYMYTPDRAKSMLKELKLDNHTIDTTLKLISLHGLKIGMNAVDIRFQAAKAGADMYGKALLFEREYYRAVHDEEKYAACIKAAEIFNGIIERGECLSLKELAVKGSDLIAAGVAPGAQMGKILDGMLEAVLFNPEFNTKEYLFNNHLHI